MMLGSGAMMQRFTSPMLVRLSQRTYMKNTRIGINSNKFLILNDHDGASSPTLKFRHSDNEVALDAHLSLSQVEARMKRNNLIASNGRAEFFSPDGPRYASSCTIAEIMAFPFFRLRVDDWKDYHVVC